MFTLFRQRMSDNGAASTSESARIRRLVDTSLSPRGGNDWQAALQIAGSIASLIAVVASSGRIFFQSPRQLWTIMTSIWLLGYMSYLSWNSFRLRKAYERRARYAIILSSLHGIQHELRDAEEVILEGNSSAAVNKHVLSVLSEAARVFTIATAAPCGSAIQVLAAVGPLDVQGPEQLEVKTVYRDEVSLRTHGEFNQHKLTDSTALEAIVLDKDRRWWCSNDIPGYQNAGNLYKDPSMPLGGIAAKALPYKSMAVWPIRHRVEGGKEDLLGFFNVTSPIENSFVEPFDFELGAAISDSLYSFLRVLACDDQVVDIRERLHRAHQMTARDGPQTSQSDLRAKLT